MNRLLYATRSRRAVLELLRRERRYLTASEIHRRLAVDQPKLAISTIYRTLEMLEGLGTIARRADPDGEASFVYCGERPHHHAVCRVCGRVDEVACDAIDESASRSRASAASNSTSIRSSFSAAVRPAGARSPKALGQRENAVLVAVPIVGVVQVRCDEVVGVIAMGDGLVTARRAVRVRGVVTIAGVILTALGIERGEHVLVDVVAVSAVEMAVVKVIDVVVMLDRGVAAIGSVNVRVVGMRAVFHAASLVRGDATVNAPFARFAIDSQIARRARKGRFMRRAGARGRSH